MSLPPHQAVEFRIAVACLVLEQPALARQTAAVSGQRPVAADDAMARDRHPTRMGLRPLARPTARTASGVPMRLASARHLRAHGYRLQPGLLAHSLPHDPVQLQLTIQAQVQGGDFSLNVSPASQIVAPGGTTEFALMITKQNGFLGTGSSFSVSSSAAPPRFPAE